MGNTAAEHVLRTIMTNAEYDGVVEQLMAIRAEVLKSQESGKTITVSGSWWRPSHLLPFSALDPPIDKYKPGNMHIDLHIEFLGTEER